MRSRTLTTLAVAITAGWIWLGGFNATARGDFIAFNNGPFITGPVAVNGSFTPPAGTVVSEVQTQVGNTNLGFSPDGEFITRIADDFTIGTSTLVGGFSFFGYEQNSGTTSPFTGVTVRIFDRNPSLSGAVILAGDTTTNLLRSTSFTNVYRIRSSDVLNTQRPVMQINAALTAPILLAPGTYWVDYNLTSVAGTPVNFSPPVTIVGQTQKTGSNALLFNGTWSAIVDGGSGAAQDIPFLVLNTPEPSSWILSASAIGAFGLITMARRRTQSRASDAS